MNSKPGLRAGAAKVVITPPLVGPLAGFSERFSVEKGDLKPRFVHDDLYARACVLENGGQSVAWAACDLIGLDGFLVDEVRKIVRARTGMAPDRILLTATHSHSGPGIREGIQNDRCSYGGIPRQWKRALAGRIARAILEAFDNRRDAEITFGSGMVKNAAATRRLTLEDGSIFNISIKNGTQPPKPVACRGPIDEELGVMAIRERRGKKPIAVVLNYASHPWIAPEMWISAEVPGKVCGMIEQALGPGVTAMMLTGAGGDITYRAVLRPIPKNRRERRRWWDAELERLGGKIGREALRVVSGLSGFDPDPVIRSIWIPCALDLKVPRQSMPSNNNRRRSLATLMKRPGQTLFRNNRINTEIMAFRLGKNILVGLPGEVLCRLGLDIKRKFLYNKTFVVAYCGDYIGYIPPREYYAAGGYEVEGAMVRAGSGEKLRNAALAGCRRLLNT